MLLRASARPTSRCRSPRRLIDSISEPIPLAGNTARIGASVGVAVATGGHHRRGTLIPEADAAAYIAKSQRARARPALRRLHAPGGGRAPRPGAGPAGRDRAATSWSSTTSRSSTPGPGVLEGYEALVRWDRPGAGLLQPDAFLPVAEASDLICDVDRGCSSGQPGSSPLVPDVRIRRGCTSRSTCRRGTSPGRASSTDVAWALDQSGVDRRTGWSSRPARRCLADLSGSVAPPAPAAGAGGPRQRRRLRRRASARCRGSRTCRSTSVKIDRRYVDVGTAPAGRLLHLMVEGAHAVGLSAVAQGVEHDAELETLRSLDCESVQGFHIARPMPAEEAEAYYRDRVADRVRRAAVEAFWHLEAVRRGHPARRPRLATAAPTTGTPAPGRTRAPAPAPPGPCVETPSIVVARPSSRRRPAAARGPLRPRDRRAAR